MISSMQNTMPTVAVSPVETEEEITIQEKEKMINISYELAAEASKRSKLVAGRLQTEDDMRRRASNHEWRLVVSLPSSLFTFIIPKSGWSMNSMIHCRGLNRLTNVVLDDFWIETTFPFQYTVSAVLTWNDHFSPARPQRRSCPQWL